MGSFFFHQRNNYPFHNLLDGTLFLQNPTFADFRSDLRFPISSLVLYIWQHFEYKKFCHHPPAWPVFCICIFHQEMETEKKKFKWKAFLENHKCWWLVSTSGHMQVLRTFSNTFLNYPFLVADKINLHLWKVPSLGLLGCCEAFCVLKVRVLA